jgi:hypothetical protein
LNTGWSHTVYHYQITSCMCSEAGSEWDKHWLMALGILLSRRVWRSRTAHLTWLSPKNRRWWRKTTDIFEFSVKSSIRNRYFPPCAKKQLNFVVQWICKYTHFFTFNLPVTKKTVGDEEKLLIQSLKVLLGTDIFLRVPKKC